MNEAELREVLGGDPTELVKKKIADRLNPLTRQFVERSPFVVVATGSPDGGLDVSPRGDPAGFVRILDADCAPLPDPGGQRHVPGQRPRADRGRPGTARLQRGRGKGAAPRDPRRGRGGVHAVPEGAPSLRPLERRAAHRPLRAAGLGRDPACRGRPGARRRGVRRGPRRAVPAARRVLLARGALPFPGVEQLLHVPSLLVAELEARGLEVLPGRDRLPQLAPQPAEEAYLRGFHAASVAALAGRYRSAAWRTISAACSLESWSVLTTRS
ncbi:MAG: pyridoxamine 5'-phosphate oxidase family protein [Acidobacteria bacterium]|nr:pyridoxamine 5'-phosphate oxidase family protein [Acidobacteriota bacterium]